MNTSKFKFITDLPRRRQEIAAPVARSDTVRFMNSAQSACGNGRQRPMPRSENQRNNKEEL